MRLLLVEDDEKLAASLTSSLGKQGYKVKNIKNGLDARVEILVENYDLIILDIMLPGIDGLTVLQEIRDNSVDTPVLLLTARDQIEDKVDGLNKGADDYLPKPFAFAELLARIHALLRRKSEHRNPMIRIENLTINTLANEIRVNDQPVELTLKEYAIFEFLVYNTNRVVSRLSIAEHVWDDNFDLMTNVVDVHIKNIRKKIEKAGGTNVINTIRGIGYIIKQDKENDSFH